MVHGSSETPFISPAAPLLEFGRLAWVLAYRVRPTVDASATKNQADDQRGHRENDLPESLRGGDRYGLSASGAQPKILQT